jgi:hypothetical protein
MRKFLFQNRHGEVRVSPAAALADECHGMIRQMTLPLIPQRRVKGALATISRDSGVSYSKLRKIYYRLTDHILAFELRSITAAYERYVVSQERALERELTELRELRAAREMRERHGVLSLTTPADNLGAVDREARQA